MGHPLVGHVPGGAWPGGRDLQCRHCRLCEGTAVAACADRARQHAAMGSSARRGLIPRGRLRVQPERGVASRDRGAGPRAARRPRRQRDVQHRDDGLRQCRGLEHGRGHALRHRGVRHSRRLQGHPELRHRRLRLRARRRLAVVPVAPGGDAAGPGAAGRRDLRLRLPGLLQGWERPGRPERPGGDAEPRARRQRREGAGGGLLGHRRARDAAAGAALGAGHHGPQGGERLQVRGQARDAGRHRLRAGGDRELRADAALAEDTGRGEARAAGAEPAQGRPHRGVRLLRRLLLAGHGPAASEAGGRGQRHHHRGRRGDRLRRAGDDLLRRGRGRSAGARGMRL
mmetsp:Transcript_12752/g.30140  ORF Transcript_12752/g.30140 Transcript_12752/m.30140 type:complete len:342 (+) Transcript_12752:781-1806(+)